MPVEQAQLFEETIDADLAAMEEELVQLSPTPAKAKGEAKCQPLPVSLPRTDIHHEPETTVCPCGCTMKPIGEDAVGAGTGVSRNQLATERSANCQYRTLRQLA